jgi:hypothetical protein
MDEEPPLTSSYDDLENRPNKLFTPNKYITHGKGKSCSFTLIFATLNIINGDVRLSFPSYLGFFYAVSFPA